MNDLENKLNNLETESTETTTETLKDLKAQADLLGIPYPANANAKKMVELLDDYKKKYEEEDTQTTSTSDTSHISPRTDKIGNIMDEATKLIRVRITVNNPSKQNREGEIISAGNTLIGFVSKFIPYQPAFYENGYHIPKIILDVMRDMKHARFPKKKDRLNVTLDDYSNVRMVPDFTIEELPPLTEEELKALAEYQQANRTVEDK